jgi:thiaminase (transcriptional activator TenA)
MPWIDMYSSNDFHEATKTACDIMDSLAVDASPKIHSLMEQAFVHSSQLEFLFWDGAYRLEKWTY